MGIILIGLVGIIAGIWVLTLDFSLKLWAGILMIVVGVALVGMKLFQSYLDGRNPPSN